MTSTSTLRRLVATASLAVCTAVGACAPPSVLVDNSFVGDHGRTVKIVIKKNPTGLFDEFVRVCDLTAEGQEGRCQDTLVLTDVNPSSVY